MNHPYAGAPDYRKWPKAVTALRPGEVDPSIRFPFRITKTDRVATAGSCFAQHIARSLAGSGYNYFVAERAHVVLGNTAAHFGYGLFSARYGNIYTSRQLLQLIKRAYGTFSPLDTCWQAADQEYYDPLRPSVQPGGFISPRALEIDVAQHLAAVREMFENLDYFVFTLGLTELWTHRDDGLAYPMCPGTIAGTFDPDKHVFLNLSVDDVVADMSAFFALLKGVNPKAKIILTVSPVALAATAEDQHVVCSTVYSKSVLRVAADMLSRRSEDIAYFPSFEIITGPQTRGVFFDKTVREVTPAGVAHVMSFFLKNATAEQAGSRDEDEPTTEETPSAEQMAKDLSDIVKAECDEVMLGA